MKKFWLLAALLGLWLVLAACGSETGSDGGEEETSGEAGGSENEQAAAEEDITLKLGTIRTEDDPTTQSANHFAELVNEKSDGSITVDVFPNSELGDINDMFSGMNTNTVDMMYEGISSYGWMEGAEAFNILSLPFYWESYDQMVEILDSEEFQPIFDEAAEATGVRVIKSIGDTEARQLTANQPVESADDFNGLKIRTAEAPIVQRSMEALGAEPVVVPFSDLYMALNQGTADAQENGFITVENSSFYEVQDYVMETNYIRDVKSWYISEELWQSLSSGQQEIMSEAAVEAGEMQTELAREQINESLDFLKENMEYIEPDVDSIREALEPTAEEFDGDLWPEGLLDTVNELKEQ
ncbi:TRAP transporter substrate-binding protein [Salibacterium aidingense]|uniref:TRAP transporter substrate-binding protein n=1 Tax=Salibacterium aidingense TaxID=384933 RepID=UPI0004172913|nr:TRAP transporter substrate-binding protein [Salibacterium aidingense]